MDAEMLETLRKRAMGYDIEDEDGKTRHVAADYRFFKEYQAQTKPKERRLEHLTTEELIEELKKAIKFLEEEQL